MPLRCDDVLRGLRLEEFFLRTYPKRRFENGQKMQ